MAGRPLRVEVITLFPKMVEGPAAESILGRAQKAGLLSVRTRDLRPYGIGKHRLTDDSPYGGGAGMVMKPEPLVAAIEAARAELASERAIDPAPARPARVLLLDPQGAPFVQATAARLSREDALVLVCGRYEGIDERVRPHVDETVSLGDFVLTGGEFAALCVLDAVARLRPGVLGNDSSSEFESHSAGLLEGPQYTRPVEFRGARVPDVLLSGDHAEVARWRRRQALARTLAHRPGLLAEAPLDATGRALLAELRQEAERAGAPTEAAERGVRAGQDWTEQERTGQERTGQERTGQERTGQTVRRG
jgi:tRNA (guanine37-N1)-methyltransferase